MKDVAIVAAAIVVGCDCTAAFAQTDSLVTFVNVNVVSMDREEVEPARTVTVRGDRIVAIDAPGRGRRAAGPNDLHVG